MRVHESSAISVTVKLTVVDCAHCGQIFGMTDELVARRRKDGATFWCPQGHANFYGDNENLRLQAQLDQEQAARERAERQQLALIRQLKAEQAAHTRTLKRVQAGVCPHCNRTFQNLARHMGSKHAPG